MESLFSTHLNHLAEITQHAISKTQKNPNLTIYLTSDKHYAKVIKNHTRNQVKNLERESHCMGSFQTNKNNEIIQADIVIPVDHVFNRGLLVACIVEETTQIMGLTNDSDWVNPSIANDASKQELLTGLDYILLKLLYSQKMKAGMSFAQSQAVITKEIKQFENAGEIKQAHKTVNQSGLYPRIN